MDRYMYVCAWGGIVYDMLVLVQKEVPSLDMNQHINTLPPHEQLTVYWFKVFIVREGT